MDAGDSERSFGDTLHQAAQAVSFRHRAAVRRIATREGGRARLVLQPATEGEANDAGGQR